MSLQISAPPRPDRSDPRANDARVLRDLDDDAYEAFVRRYASRMLADARRYLRREKRAWAAVIDAFDAAKDDRSLFSDPSVYLRRHLRVCAGRLANRNVVAPVEAPRRIDRLPDRLRIAFVLCHADRLDPAEIAEVLETPERDVWERLRCAAHLLRTRPAGESQ